MAAEKRRKRRRSPVVRQARSRRASRRCRSPTCAERRRCSVDGPAAPTCGSAQPAPIIPFRGRFWAQRARQRRTPHRSTAGRKSEARRTRHNAQIRNQATLCQTRLLTFVVAPSHFHQGLFICSFSVAKMAVTHFCHEVYCGEVHIRSARSGYRKMIRCVYGELNCE